MADNSRDYDTNQFNTFDAGSDFNSYDNKQGYLAAIEGGRQSGIQAKKMQIDKDDPEAR